MKYPYLGDLIVNHLIDKIEVLHVEKSQIFHILTFYILESQKKPYLNFRLSAYPLVTLTDFCLLFTGNRGHRLR